MDWKKKRLNHFKLYAVTDLADTTRHELSKIDRACRGGADIIQLRSKSLTDAALLAFGRKVRKLVGAYQKLFIVNDRVDLALALKADGVHLGQDDMALPVARKLVRQAGMKMLFGVSTHDLRQACAAERDGADYIGVGPVFTTPTKPEKKGLGLKLVKQVAERIKIPYVAIGGIDCSNIEAVIAAGATRVAVVRAVFAAKDPLKAAQKIKAILER